MAAGDVTLKLDHQDEEETHHSSSCVQKGTPGWRDSCVFLYQIDILCLTDKLVLTKVCWQSAWRLDVLSFNMIIVMCVIWRYLPCRDQIQSGKQNPSYVHLPFLLFHHQQVYQPRDQDDQRRSLPRVYWLTFWTDRQHNHWVDLCFSRAIQLCCTEQFQHNEPKRSEQVDIQPSGASASGKELIFPDDSSWVYLQKICQ